jgi:hypothetical protein
MFDQGLLVRAAAYVEELERRCSNADSEEERRKLEIQLKNARGVAWCAVAWELVRRPAGAPPPAKSDDRR